MTQMPGKRLAFRSIHGPLLLPAVAIVLLLVSTSIVQGSSYSSLSLQPSASITSPPLFLQSGTAGSSTIYTNNTSAKVSTVAPAPTPTYNASSYNIVTGTYASGSVPADIQTVDTNYLIVRSAGTATSTTAYNPSGYDLLGNTALVSGTTSDLVSNNGVYIQYRSYEIVSTAKTDASIAYRDSTISLAPKERTWTGDTTSWGAQAELPVLTFGKTSIGGSSASHSTTNSKMACKYSPTSSGTIRSIGLYISMDGDTTIYLGIYSDSSGAPSSLLGSGSVSATGTAGWKTVSGLSISVTSGVAYWLMVNFPSQQVTYYYDAGSANQFVYQATTADTPPPDASFGSGTYSARAMSIYATSSSPIRFARVAYCPISERSTEKIVVALSDDGYLDAYVWNGTSWTQTNYIGNVGTVANAYKSFDIAYEKTSGEALLVYSVVSTDTTQDLAYKTWIYGTGWSTEGYIDDTEHSTDLVYRWVSMASNPVSGSNEITMVAIDGSSTDANGWVWSGSSWGAIQSLTDAVALTTEECIAVAYEQTSGRAWAAAGTTTAANTFYMRSQTSGSWNATTESKNVGGIPNWCTLKADPASNYLLLTSVDGGSDLNTVYYTGSGSWTLHTETDAAVDSNAQRPADFAWEPTGEKGLLVWGTNAGEIRYRSYTAPNTWSELTNATMGVNIHPWVQLRTNTRSVNGDVKILGAVLEETVFDIGAIQWDGTTFTVIGSNTISADTRVITYECFEVEFQNLGPKQFESEIELTGASNTESWNELVWSFDSAWTIGSVTVTIQVYNYTGAGEYPTSGVGFKSYISNSIANTEEAMTETMITNPTHFRDGSGNWKMKVQGVKKTTTQFDFKADWVEFKPSHYSEYKASTEFLLSSMTSNTPTQLNFTVVGEYDIASVSVTIQVWNYSSSAYMTSGEGYLTYTSSGSNETRLLSMNTSPQFYTSSGNAKIRITGAKTTTTQYQQKTNQVKLLYKYNSSSTYDYVLGVANQVSDVWKIRLKAYAQNNIERLNNCTIDFHNSTDGTSHQISVANGGYTQQTGTWYDLKSAATIYVSMTLQAADSQTSQILVYLEILTPTKTTYAQYILTFQIT